MTNTEFLKTIVDGTEITEEMKTFATEALEKRAIATAKANEKAKAKRIEASAEKEPIRNAILEVLGAEPMTANAIVEAVTANGVELKKGSIPSLLKPLVEEGKVVKTEVKSTTKSGGKVLGYKLA